MIAFVKGRTRAIFGTQCITIQYMTNQLDDASTLMKEFILLGYVLIKQL